MTTPPIAPPAGPAAITRPGRRSPRRHRAPPAPGLLRRAARDGRGILAALLAFLLAIALWAALLRPVAVPDYVPSRAAAGAIGGLALSPFQRGQSPPSGIEPSRAEVRADLVLAAGLTRRVRTYSVAGMQGEIPALAEGLKLRITAGAWLDGHVESDTAELGRLIALAGAHRNIERVLVGNETLLRHDLTPAQLIRYIGRVRQAIRQPVSTAEPWHVWLAHPELAASVDFITIHLLPYWEGLPVDQSLRYVMDRLAAVQAAYPGKPVVIGEVGWPSDGVDVGAAHASRVNEAAFLRQFFTRAAARGLDYFVMEAFDQPWKTAQEGRAAGYWGMLDLDRHAKWALTGPVSELPGWPGWAVPAAGLAALLTVLLLAARPDMAMAGRLVLAGLAQALAGLLACLLLTMAGKYLSAPAAALWGALALGQTVLALLLLADGFELTETLWGRRWSRAYRPQAAPVSAALPKVSLHLPICNEPPAMVCQTLDALARLDYPAFEVLVIDNNTTDPALWEPVAEHCARLGARFRFYHLGRHPGFKAGALNFAARHAAPDAAIIGVLDSDYVVAPDWLRCMVPAFADPGIGFVQSPQDYRDGAASWFKTIMFWEYAGFFRLGMVTRNERNAIIQHGTMTLIRRPALEAIGGWAEWCITEDAELGLRLFRAGWRAAYAPQGFGRGLMPDDFAAYRRQRFRWAYGAMRICRAHAGALCNPRDRSLTLGQRWHFVTGWLPWVGDALGLLFLLMGLAWSIGLIAAPQRFEFPVVLFMLPSVLLFGFKLAHLLLLYRERVPCGWAERLGAAVAGLALSHTIARAVWQGLLGRRVPFRRTPKLAAAPAIVQGLAMAGEEAAFLVLTWAALAGVGAAHHVWSGGGTVEARLWCAVLFTQSLPYVASVGVSVLAAVPARRAHLLAVAAGGLAVGGEAD